MVDPTTGASKNSISSISAAKINVTAKNADGSPASAAVVKFTTDAALARFDPASGSVLTDENGKASILIVAADTVTAGAATVDAIVSIAGGATASGSIGFSVAATGVVNTNPTITISLVDPTNQAPRQSISSASPGLVKAVVKNGNGSPASGIVVTFITNAALATITPSSQTALTDSAGTASVTIAANAISTAGAAEISATAQVGSNSVSASTAYTVGATNVTLSNPLTLGTATLSAFGTTSISVTVLSNGTPFASPLSVNFTSGCAANNRADLTANVTTTNGVATASYRDKGCSGPDTITATLSGISATSSATLTVLAANTGAIQFVSATPTQITLKGTGGAGLKETSEVRFKVLDVGGNPVGGKTVNFQLSTTVGGIQLTSASAVSDPTTGEAITNVVAGTVSTPVRVLATTTNSAGAQLATQSDQLTITTGVPTQSSFSLSATAWNIEGWRIDGAPATLTVRLADHFGNPPAAGAVVNFISEGAKVNGTCTSATTATALSSGVEAGACSVLFTSQNLRPDNGRVSVLAYAVGEESFVDQNGNGKVDSATELVDANGRSTVGLGEAFVDFNEDGLRQPTEPFVDFDGGGAYQSSSDGKYRGILCDPASGLCGTDKTLHIRETGIVILSGSDPYISSSAPGFNLPLCGGSQTINFTISDLHGNAMPAGTTVAVSTSNGSILAVGGNLTVPSTQACMDTADAFAFPGQAQLGLPPTGTACPASARNRGVLTYSVAMGSDGTIDATTGVCANPVKAGFMTITVTTPGAASVGGTKTGISFPVNEN
ncbi:MAG: hypothetical protein WCB36_02265 [Burkholderiales bacterium]